jgi:hypothetical protein
MYHMPLDSRKEDIARNQPEVIIYARTASSMVYEEVDFRPEAAVVFPWRWRDAALATLADPRRWRPGGPCGCASDLPALDRPSRLQATLAATRTGEATLAYTI